MDNRVFNVNGAGIENLEAILSLLLNENKFKGIVSYKVVGWRIDKEKGFILYWHVKDANVTPFPTNMSAKWLAPLIMNWLESDEAKEMQCTDWDSDTDHDGSNEYGFRVYTEEWGHINFDNGGIDHYTIGAVRPAYLWYGK